MELFAVAAVLGYALALNRRFKWPTHTCLLPVCACIVCILFATGLAGSLLPAAKLLLGGGLVMFAAAIALRVAGGSGNTRHSAGTLFFVGGSLFLFFLTRLPFYSQLHAIDDF